MQKRVSILGATGSIGASTLDLIRRNPERFRVVALTAQAQVDELARLALEFRAECAVIGDPAQHGRLKARLAGSGIEAMAGAGAIAEAARRPADLVVSAIMGAAGVRPTFAAIDAGTTVALANKESLVAAGDLMMSHARAKGVAILPMDSEHNALAQALAGHALSDVEALTITASGGPFREWPREAIEAATVEQALKHPNWTMGAKITIDSASMMNKGLELIEAHHLFGLPADRLKVLVHPQSIVHGLVHYRDGSVLAHLGPHDMRVAIAHCLAFPERLDGPVERLDLARIGTLSFEPPDEGRFPCLKLAREALFAGGCAPCVMNAANEVAVAAFLKKAIPFGQIAMIVAEVLAELGHGPAPQSLDALDFIDHSARNAAQRHL